MGLHVKEFMDKEGITDNIIPVTYDLSKPSVYVKWLRLLAENDFGEIKQYWIVKPVHRAGGKGISIINTTDRFVKEFFDDNYEEFEKTSKLKDHLVQHYIHNPFLLYGRKFDFRVYMLISSFEPAQAWYFRGYLRVNVKEFDFSDISDTYAHICNLAVNKKHEDYDELDSKKYFSELEEFLQANNIVDAKNYVDEVLEPELIRRMSILYEAHHKIFNEKENHPGHFFFAGVDFIMDENLNPYLIEVTTGPGFSNEKCDKFGYLDPMMDGLFNIMFETRKRKASGESIIGIDTDVNTTGWKLIPRYPAK
eukprot:TRINITY_DN431_c0_g1_i1.p1 TRINITY_DN431_c0_g1~~TRINITY_DN431_c0_g1_i1.p1  ORF type:complete len:308 (+),score=65.94 TRINITY_DN431_c0_g1_i1:654-1577(+)